MNRSLGFLEFQLIHQTPTKQLPTPWELLEKRTSSKIQFSDCPTQSHLFACANRPVKIYPLFLIALKTVARFFCNNWREKSQPDLAEQNDNHLVCCCQSACAFWFLKPPDLFTTLPKIVAHSSGIAQVRQLKEKPTEPLYWQKSCSCQLTFVNRQAIFSRFQCFAVRTVAHPGAGIESEIDSHELALLPCSVFTFPRLLTCVNRVTRLLPTVSTIFLRQLPIARKPLNNGSPDLSWLSSYNSSVNSRLRRRACANWLTKQEFFKDMNRINQTCLFLRREKLNCLKLTFRSLGTFVSLVFLLTTYSCTRVFKTASKVFKYCYLNASGCWQSKATGATSMVKHTNWVKHT